MADEGQKQDAEATPKKSEGEGEAALSFSPPRQDRKWFPRGSPRLGTLVSGVLLTLVVVLGIITLVVWLVYRPHKPSVYVERASIYELNVTDGSVTSNMQFSVLFQNPNRRWSLRYERLVAFVTYRGQIITMVTPLPSVYQGHHSMYAVYTYVSGQFVPVFPDVANGIMADEGFGFVELRLEIRGKFRWRTALWKSVRNRLYASCDLLVGTKNSVNGEVPLFRGQRCDVNI